MALPDNPITRKEAYLAKIAGQSVDLPEYPITREEAYLNEIAKNGGGGGGYVLPTATANRLGGVKIGSGINVEEDGTISASGGSGTDDYNDLDNQPQINGVTLSGNKTTSDLGITASGVGAIPSTDKGANGGVAELDSNGKVPSSQLPSYVDDVLSYASQSTFPATGETGKIYIAEDTNKTYRWSGSVYAEISESLALGETSSTAYRGDRGKAAYDHSQTTGNPHGTTASDVGLGNVPNVSTNDQEPTFTEASTRNNIASGEKLSVILGKIQKFFNDLKSVAYSGSFSDLSNKPENANTFQGTIAEWNQLTTAEKKAYDHASIPDSLDGNVTFPASKVMMQNGNSVQNEMHYKYGGAIVGTDGLQLPNDWNELLIFAQYGTSGGLQNQTLQVTINKDITSKLPYGAYIFGAGTMAGQAYISNNTLSLLSFQVNGTEYKATSKIFYYYR